MENTKNNINKYELIIKYKTDINENDKIRLFGNEFVQNNKKNCKIIIDLKEYDLYTHWYKFKVEKEILEIKLKIIKPLTNMTGMFSMCNSLLSSSDFSSLDTSKVTTMKNLFYKCSLLT